MATQRIDFAVSIGKSVNLSVLASERRRLHKSGAKRGHRWCTARPVSTAQSSDPREDSRGAHRDDELSFGVDGVRIFQALVLTLSGTERDMVSQRRGSRSDRRIRVRIL
jgi:hypothetical protein